MMIACFKVKALDPTDVPMAFATSLAPILQAMKRPKITAKAVSQAPCGIAFSPACASTSNMILGLVQVTARGTRTGTHLHRNRSLHSIH